ncbi:MULTISPECIES: CHAT domain-containing tetratricopeptide repeat protein [unclassified Sphingomonas]|uniref:CHAT domain-containing tetratricopeptide repeat protein n=1 Tax=unclassified Sphingomonas TaxID=196159 RepID=UPI000AE1A260|nr:MULTISPECIES: CHAT domain-containing tetratricopeptide repeat protein [unclassified Sphingomonas]
MLRGEAAGLLAALALALAVPCLAAEPTVDARLARIEAGIGAATAERRWGDAIALGREALAIEEATKGADHPEVGGTLSLIADWTVRQGKPADATPLYRRALAIFTAKLGPDDRLSEQAASNLAANLQAVGRHEEAEGLYRAALARAQAKAGEESRATALAYNNLAYALGRQGRFSEARDLYAKALGIALRWEPEDLDLALIEGNVASNLDALGRPIEAEPLYRQSLAVRIAELGSDNPAVATSYNNLGFNLDGQGRHVDAAPAYRRALRIRTAIDPEGLAAATSYNNVAHNLNRQGDYAGAAPLYARALAIWQRTYGSDHPMTAIGLSNVAVNLERQGKAAEAQPLFERALAIRLATLRAGHPDIATARLRLGHVLVSQRRFDTALPDYEQGVAARRAAFGADHPALAEALTDLADLYLALGRPADAVKAAREAAEIVRRRRAGRIGEARESDGAQQAVARAEAADASRFDPLAGAFATLIRADWAEAARSPRQAAALRAEAFLAAQDLSVSAAARSMARTAARTAAGEGPLGALVRQQQGLSDHAAELDAQLLRQLIAGDSQKIARTRDLSAANARDLAEADRALARAFPAYARLIGAQSLAIDAARARLGKDGGLLLIVVAGDDLYSFAIGPKQVRWSRREAAAAPVAAAVRRLRCQVDPKGCGDATPGWPPFDRAAAFGLYRDLVAPVEPALAGSRSLFVVTGGALAELPLGLLPTAPPAAGDSDAEPAVLQNTPWLADRYAVTVLPAVSVLRAGEPAAPGAAGGRVQFVGYGAPSFLGPAGGGRNIDDFLRIPQPVDRAGQALADPSALRELSPLPGTEIELKAMAATLSATPELLHLGSAATEGAVRRDTAVGGARVIAFATHGILPGEIGGLREPGLAFTPPEKSSSEDDGLLAASEVAGMHLSADWVILSACNTATADGTPGADSLSSLGRAFLYAGAGSLLASRWRVADDATAALTVETLAARKAGLSRAAALQRAMRTVRLGRRADGSALPGWSPAWAHPAAWAPFTVIGSDDG